LNIEGILPIILKKIERSDSPNSQSSIVNIQFGSGFSGSGYYNELFACRGNQPQLLFGDFGNPLGRF
jgi:hypothetical protein